MIKRTKLIVILLRSYKNCHSVYLSPQIITNAMVNQLPFHFILHMWYIHPTDINFISTLATLKHRICTIQNDFDEMTFRESWFPIRIQRSP